MNQAQRHDVGSYLDAAFARIPVALTTSTDGSEANGDAIDRFATAGRAGCLSGTLFIVWSTTLTEAATLTLAANMQDDSVSAFNVDVADYGTALASAVVATGGTGGSTSTGVSRIDVDLGPAKRYLRCQITATLSAGSADTVAIAAIFVFGGSDRVPVV